jgi:acylphosphatase
MVQGVGFRESMRIEAREQGVTGWARNRRDGTVEAVLHGPAEAVERVVAWAGRGPTTGQVTSIEVENAEGMFESFVIRPTA